MKFTDRILLENNKLVLIYRCKKGGSIDFFSYVLADADGAKRMHADYESGKASQPYDYGEVLYSDLLKDPDEKAKEFLAQWVAQNSAFAL